MWGCPARLLTAEGRALDTSVCVCVCVPCSCDGVFLPNLGESLASRWPPACWRHGQRQLSTRACLGFPCLFFFKVLLEARP